MKAQHRLVRTLKNGNTVKVGVTENNGYILTFITYEGAKRITSDVLLTEQAKNALAAMLSNDGILDKPFTRKEEDDFLMYKAVFEFIQNKDDA